MLFHNYHDNLEGFGWIGHVIVEWGNCLFSPERNWSYISTPLEWHTSLRWMMFRNILQAFICFSCFIFNRVWIISSIICLSLVRWSVKDNRLWIISLIWCVCKKFMISSIHVLLMWDIGWFVVDNTGVDIPANSWRLSMILIIREQSTGWIRSLWMNWIFLIRCSILRSNNPTHDYLFYHNVVF